MHNRHGLAVTCFGACVAAILAVSTAAADEHIVRLGTKPTGGLAFKPSDLTIKAGDEIIWVYQDGGEHTVTPDTAGAFVGSTTDITEGNPVFSVTFPAASEPIPYHCEVHPDMKGTITISSP